MNIRTLTITISGKTDSNPGVTDLIQLLTRAIWQVETDGEFIGNSNTGYRGDTANGIKSTKDKVAHFYNNPIELGVPEEMFDEAHRIVKHFRELSVDEWTKDFIKECYEIAQNPAVNMSKIGFVVAMVPTYRKKLEIDNHTKEFEDSDYVGVVGKRQNFFVKFLSKKYIATNESFLYTFMDRRKNIVKTWVNIDKDEAWNFQKSDCIDLDAFVRKHEANKFNDIRETYINRIKIIVNKGIST
jgi:hypothetical protein|tara:strand:+ start:1009 stop:1734 length:726 start_codon:yes stop_codon:yes gene_type:complete